MMRVTVACASRNHQLTPLKGTTAPSGWRGHAAAHLRERQPQLRCLLKPREHRILGHRRAVAYQTVQLQCSEHSSSSNSTEREWDRQLGYCGTEYTDALLASQAGYGLGGVVPRGFQSQH